MPIETATFIHQLDPANPLGSDLKSTLDNHQRLVKSALQATFPAITGAITASHTNLNKVGLTQTPGSNSTDPASTAFVQAAVAAAIAAASVGAGGGAAPIPIVTVTGTTQTMVAGSHYVFNNVGAVTATLPGSPTQGQSVRTTFVNSLTTNVVGHNGNAIMGIAQDITLDIAQTNILWQYLNSSWRI